MQASAAAKRLLSPASTALRRAGAGGGIVSSGRARRPPGAPVLTSIGVVGRTPAGATAAAAPSTTIRPFSSSTSSPFPRSTVSNSTQIAALVAAAAVTAAAAFTLSPSYGGDTDVADKGMQKDWDEFMDKSVVPGEDDDEDDDDEEEDEDEGEEEAEGEEGENGQGPADETEDSREVLLDEDQRDHVDPHEQEEAPEGDGDDDAGAVNNGSAPQGPADTEEDDEDQQPENDPYDNLPEEDEPTGCTICLINRQGPCRPYWRKFERCMKDHGDAKEGESPMAGAGSKLAEMCDKYMLPWLTCIQSRRNTYTLITNRFYQDEYVDKLEGAIRDDQRGEGEGFLEGDTLDLGQSLDLSLWMDYVRDSLASAAKDDEIEKEMEEARAFLKSKEGEEGGVSPDDSVNLAAAATGGDSSSEPSPAAAPTEEEQDVDPELVTATATIRLRDPSAPSSSSMESAGHHPIDLAYARDQDGNLLGFEQFSDAKKAMRAEAAAANEAETSSESPSSGRAEKSEDGEGGEEEKSTKEPIPTTGKLTFHIQPGMTQSVTIYAIYREDRPDEDDDDEELPAKEHKDEEAKAHDSKESPPTRPPAEERLYSSRVLSLFSDEVLAGVQKAGGKEEDGAKAADCGSEDGKA